MARVRVASGWVVAFAVVVVGLSSCASMKAQQQAGAPSVYKQLGGREGIAIIVDDFAANVLADDRINARFKALQPTNRLESAIAISLPPGEYVAVVSGENGATGIGLAEMYADRLGADSGVSYVSARGIVGNSALVSSVRVGGNSVSNFIVRALGPSLTDGGISNPLSDPILEIYDSNGVLVASNDDWVADANQAHDRSNGLFRQTDMIGKCLRARELAAAQTTADRRPLSGTAGRVCDQRHVSNGASMPGVGARFHARAFDAPTPIVAIIRGARRAT